MGRNEAAVALFVWCVGLAPSGPAQPEAGLTIRVHGHAGFDDGWPSRARMVVERVFRDAGLRVLWINCIGEAVADPLCAREPAPGEFVVRIRAERDDPRAQGCGVSLRPVAGPGHYATVFDDCITAAADDLGIAEAVVGGHIIAHEIGHLLLPVGHAPRGLMRANLDRSDWARALSGELRFTEAEGRQMLKELQRRASSADAAAGR
jgi:hypothetical protein